MKYRLLFLAATLLLLAAPALAAETQTQIQLHNNTVAEMPFAIEVDDGSGSGQGSLEPGNTADIIFQNYAHENTSLHSNKLVLYRGQDILMKISVNITNRNIFGTGPVITLIQLHHSPSRQGCKATMTHKIQDSGGITGGQGWKSLVTITIGHCGD